MKNLIVTFLSAWYGLLSSMVLSRVIFHGFCDQTDLLVFTIFSSIFLIVIGILYALYVFVQEIFK